MKINLIGIENVRNTKYINKAKHYKFIQHKENASDKKFLSGE